MIKLFNSFVPIRNYMIQLHWQTSAIKFIMLMSLGNIILYNSHFFYFALTEHEYVWLDNRKYEKLKQISASFQSDNFLPIHGFEYLNLIAGHYVVLNTNPFKSSWGDLSPDDLYSWLKKPEQKDAFVIFAHPGFIFY